MHTWSLRDLLFSERNAGVNSKFRAGVQRLHAETSFLTFPGIDGRYNDGCKELADYLLFDFFETQRTEFERCSFV